MVLMVQVIVIYVVLFKNHNIENSVIFIISSHNLVNVINSWICDIVFSFQCETVLNFYINNVINQSCREL